LDSIDEIMPNIIKELKLDLKCKRREKESISTISRKNTQKHKPTNGNKKKEQ
jgi:hypothetical protein